MFLYAIFILLSLILTIDNHLYHQSRYFNSSRAISGVFYQISNNLRNYLDLKQQNEILVKENQKLRAQILNKPNYSTTMNNQIQYEVDRARVIKNNFSAPNNYLTINKGWEKGVIQDMGVISPLGIVGIVENTSKRFATVQSILNTKSRINAKIKGSDHFGSLIWNHGDASKVTLLAIPKTAIIKTGDTIITGGMSSIFPEGVLIGSISKIDVPSNESSYIIEVTLFNDMTNLGDVYLIRNRNQQEILRLQKQTLDE